MNWYLAEKPTATGCTQSYLRWHACGIQLLNQALNPGLPHREYSFSTAPPGKSPVVTVKFKISISSNNGLDNSDESSH